jgi:hypothetical protein
MDALFKCGIDGGIANTALHSIGKCPIDLRREIISHIVIVGGGSMLPGMRSRFIEEMRALIFDDVHLTKASVFDAAWAPEPMFAGNIMQWVGGSIISLVDNSCVFSISLELFTATIRENQEMGQNFLPASPSLLAAERGIDSLLDDWLNPVNNIRSVLSEASEQPSSSSWSRDLDGNWNRKEESGLSEGCQWKAAAVAGVGVV